jgi:hypothetical protein
MDGPPPLPPPARRDRRFLWSAAVAFAAGLAYAGLARWLFQIGGEGGRQLSEIVGISFVFLVPFAIAALAVYVGSRGRRWNAGECIGVSCALTAAYIAGSLLLGFEAVICILMAAPIMVVMAMVGALAAYAIRRWWEDRRGGDGRLLISFCVLLPYLAAPLEQMLALPHAQRTAHTSIAIAAPPEAIWPQIARVPRIAPEELRRHWVYLIGFPRPLEATLSHDGVGGVREATFERSVRFWETVTRWEPGRRLSFTIRADGDFIPPATFDRHVTVGGEFFDVLEGDYRIEPRPDGTSILHLSSTHRLSTRFNWYAGLWSEWIMSDIQRSILEVIRARCEQAAMS